MTDCINDAGISTLVLINDEEFVLRASQSLVQFDNYSQVTNFEQIFTLTLERGRNSDYDSHEDACIPIIVSPLSTHRFELSVADATLSPFESILYLNEPQIYRVNFFIPKASESDYVWDNFQDRIVIHTKLSKLVIRLEARKSKTSLPFRYNQERNTLFPASLPDIKSPPLRLFDDIKRKTCSNQGHQSDGVDSHAGQTLIENDKSDIRRRDSRSFLSRPSLSTRDCIEYSSSPPPILTTIQSQHEAQAVIMALRRRRITQTRALYSTRMSPNADVLAPKMVTFDASVMIELEEFNELINAAKDRVKKDTASVKSELAYYQQLLPKPLCPPVRASRPRESRHLSATFKRPLTLLPALVRPSSGNIVKKITALDTKRAVNNQEPSPPQNHVVERPKSNTQIDFQLPLMKGFSRLPQYQIALKQRNEARKDESDDLNPQTSSPSI
ncbi:hypothetical protein Plhal304r1_c017g0061811 [Plasmopara halstedii]